MVALDCTDAAKINSFYLEIGAIRTESNHKLPKVGTGELN
jgi:hypothetical protein